MKALILAAGYGTRLLPHTKKIPKPLFTLMSKPILAHVIQALADHGCDHILINTHHLHEPIDAFVKQLNYPFPIQTLFEPVLLDTGGAIANAKPFLKESAFFVINADIVSTVNLTAAYAFHEKSNALATLVLHDHDIFNKITIDDQGYIQNFASPTKALAFTGIQVLSPQIYDYFPDKSIFSSIAVYQRLCPSKKVKAFVEKNIFWSDIGTPKAYAMTSAQMLAAAQFQIKTDQIKNLEMDPLAGDGSDRRWYRARYNKDSFIISDHGICMPESVDHLQLNAFVHIGNHLFSRKIAVPRILNQDVLSGMVILEDLGDVHLETWVKQKNDDNATLEMYKKVIDNLIDFSIKGVQGFKPEWTCQTRTYSKKLIIEQECQYFWQAFINGYLKQDLFFQDFLTEFNYIADHALKNAFTGLMHRDFQSRNIMINKGRPFFIDFQSARLGPLQYDLASLLMDPYVCLNAPIKKALLQYTTEKLALGPGQARDFSGCYQYCCLTRNLQFLGAFSFLSVSKKKKRFEHYLPDAVNSLKATIAGLDTDKLPKLSRLVQTL